MFRGGVTAACWWSGGSDAAYTGGDSGRVCVCWAEPAGRGSAVRDSGGQTLHATLLGSRFSPVQVNFFEDYYQQLN